ncbi:hypothetical protein BZG36_04984, partial [Bifiguratus adelaidae]
AHPGDETEEPVQSLNYDPYYLDDPELKTGKHRTVISLPSFLGSVIQYARPSDLKLELNEHFRQSHPEIDPTMTLSKIRNAKTKLIAIGESCDLELSSVAKAFCYFEKLILKNLVTKSNRKLVAATKVNEPKGSGYGRLLEMIEKHLGISSKDVRDHEFAIFASLEFNLYPPKREFMPHFERIFLTTDYNNIQEYLGDSAFFLEVGDARDAS